MDPNSAADASKWTTKHIHLEWLVDFAERKVSGSAELAVQKLGDSQELVLDASHLKIGSVWVNQVQCEGFKYVNEGLFGGSLTIPVPANANANADNSLVIKIEYETTEKCEALQWLNPLQTNGKKAPFLYSQCQAILARSLLPCQDTPSVKATYSADVRISGFEGASPVALMSANERSVDGDTVFHFRQSMPIPSYLIAIAVGDLECRQLGALCSVWAEPEIIEAAAWEFSETEDFLREAERLAGPYPWGTYGLLVLPASFPYGGMENPCMTFLTPSLIAGDRSLVSVVAHEITHSWTGNLATNSTWEHFWLNEGFTKFIERKIVGSFSGAAYRELLAQEGYEELKNTVAFFGPTDNLTRLVPDLKQTSPDDAFSIIPYEKGHTLLFYLERLLGGPAVFDPYLRAHIQHFAGKPLTSPDWKAFLLEYFASNVELLATVDFDAWLYEPGMPPATITYDQSLMAAVKDSVMQWKKGTWSKAVDAWESFQVFQKVMFVELLDKETKGSLQHALIDAIDAEYGLSQTSNVELALKWFLLCIHNQYEKAYPKAAEYATRHGRMKYCRPILRELYQTEGGRQLALDTFNAHRSFYHPQAARMLCKDLNLEFP